MASQTFYIQMKSLLALLLLIVSAHAQSMSISFTNRTINAATTYEVTLFRLNTNVFSNTDSIIFKFPADSYNAAQINAITCTPQCTVTQLDLSLKFAGGQLDSTTFMTSFSIQNAFNPPSSKPPDAFTAQWVSDAGTVIENYTYYFGGFDYGALKACTVTFSPNIVNTIGTATLTITPANPILAGGYLVINFPTKWNNTITNDRVINLSETFVCQSTLPALSTNINCVSNSSGALVITGFVETTNSSFVVSIDGVRSQPISILDSATTAATYDFSGNLIDNNSPCSASAPSPHTLTANLFNTVVTVASSFSPTFKFISTDAMAIGDVLKLSIINSNITSINTSRMIVIVTDTNNFTQIININATQSNTSGGVYGYVLPRMTWRSYINPNLDVYLSGMSFLGPPNTQPLDAFSIALYRGGSIYCTGTVSLTAVTNSLQDLSISAVNNLVNANTSYSLTLTTSSPLTSLGWIQVVLPGDIRTSPYSQQQCVSATGNSVSPTAICKLQGGILTVTSIFLGIVSEKTTISIKFDGVTNPGSSRPSSSFSITTFFDETTYMTDQNNLLTFTALADTISSCTVTRSSPIVGVSAVYSFLYTLKNELIANSSIVIQLPVQIIADSSLSVSISVNGSADQSKSSVLSNDSRQQVKITEPYAMSLPAGSILTIKIDSLKNPSSTKQPGAFSLFSYDGSYLIQQITSGVAVGAASPNTFQQASISSNSQINGELTTYKLVFQPSIDYHSEVILRLLVPNQVSVDANPTCSPNAGFASASLQCTLGGNLLLINVSEHLSNSIVYQILITSIKNPRTYSQTDSFELTAFIDNLSYMIDSSTITGIINSQPNVILSFTSNAVNPSQSYLNSSQTIQFNLTTSNSLNLSDYMQLTFPSIYTFVGEPSSSICSESNFICIPDTNLLNKIKITFSSLSSTNIFVFQVSGYRSPSVIPSTDEYFTINTFDSFGNPIDAINQNNAASQTKFELSCIYPCETCNQSEGKTVCQSCYNPPLNEFNYLSNKACVSSCGNGYFPFGPEPSCEPCVSPCQNCIGLSTNCTSCRNQSSNLFKYYNNLTGKCVTTCPDGYYPSVSGNNYICDKCQANCTTCNNTATNCTTCTSPFLIYLGECILTCPNGMYATTVTCDLCDASCKNCSGNSTSCDVCADGYARQNVTAPCSNQCGLKVAFEGLCQCDVSCLTCKNVITNCSSCNQSDPTHPYYLFSSNTGSCIDECPDGMYVEVGICTVCDSNCLSCSSKYICKSCLSSLILFNNSCLAQCPLGKFNQSNMCVDCAISCMTCKITSESCTSCSTKYSLFNSACVQNCPDGTVSQLVPNNGKICKQCNQSCLNCVGLANNCSSCQPNTNFYFNRCFATCPQTTIADNGKCVSCISPCQTCNNTQTSCLSCLPSFFSIKNQNSFVCVTNCSVFDLFTNGSYCIPCQKPCNVCNQSAFSCLSCIDLMFLQLDKCVETCSNGFYVLNNTCVTVCPESMKSINNICTIIQNQTIPQNNTETTQKVQIIVPVPFIIASVLACIPIIWSKIKCNQTFLPSMAVALFSIIETLSWVAALVIIILSTQSNFTRIAFYCLSISLGIHFLNNFTAIIFFCKYICKDNTFKKWYSKSAACCVKLSFVLCLVNQKWFNIIFCKAFSKSSFKAPLSHPIVFTPLQICTVIAFFPQALAVIGSAIAASDTTLQIYSQLYLLCIDIIVVSILTAICSIWNLKKPQNFFDAERNECSQARQQIMINHTVEDLVDQYGVDVLVLDRNPQNKNGLQVLYKKKTNHNCEGFSETSSEYNSQNNQQQMNTLEPKEIAVAKRKQSIQQSQVILQQTKNYLIHQNGSGKQELLDEGSIVNKLKQSQFQQNELVDQKRNQTSGPLKQNLDEKLPDKPNFSIAEHSLPTMNKTYSQQEKQTLDQRENFIFNQNFDIEIEDIANLNEQTSKIPSLSVDNSKTDTKTISLNTYKSSKLARYTKQSKIREKKLANKNSSSIPTGLNKKQIPKIPNKKKSSQYSLAEFQNTNLQIYSFPKDFFQSSIKQIPNKKDLKHIQTQLDKRSQEINETLQQIQKQRQPERSKTMMEGVIINQGKIKKQDLSKRTQKPQQNNEQLVKFDPELPDHN